MDGFEKDLLAEFDRVVGDIEKGIRQEIKAGLQKAAEFSPVDTGWLRSNYRVAVGSEDIPLEPATRPPGAGTPMSPDTAAEAQKLEHYTLETDVTIGNAVPYSIFIDGGTTKIPAGNIMERVAQSITARITKRFSK